MAEYRGFIILGAIAAYHIFFRMRFHSLVINLVWLSGLAIMALSRYLFRFAEGSPLNRELTPLDGAIVLTFMAALFLMIIGFIGILIEMKNRNRLDNR